MRGGRAACRREPRRNATMIRCSSGASCCGSVEGVKEEIALSYPKTIDGSEL